MTIGFWILAVVLVSSAIWTISARKAVYSVVALLLHFAALAFMYITLTAEFIAVVQIIVYSGAILVLFLFVIALLSSGVAPFSVGPDLLPKAKLPAAIVVLAGFGFTVYALARTVLATPSGDNISKLGPAGAPDVFGSVADFGRALFTVQLLPFEVTAFVLMVAVIGVILLVSDQTPYMGRPGRAKVVQREMREAIVRAGEE